MKLAAGLVLVAIVVAGCGGEETVASPDSVPAFECLGVPNATCEQILRDTAENRPVVAARVRCTSAGCSDARGEVSIEIVYADGSRSQSGYGWDSAPGIGAPGPVPVPADPPPLPVAPECLGVDEDHCLDAATNALVEYGDPAPIASITVTCAGICTESDGSGTTVIVVADGTRQESQWSYQDR